MRDGVVRAQLSGSEHSCISKGPSHQFPHVKLLHPRCHRIPIMTNAIALMSPSSLRIGIDKYQYDYMVLLGVSIAGRPVYRCCCGRYSSPAALHLYYSESLCVWVAEGFQHEVTNAMDIERGGEPAFRAVDADVISEGSHEWQRYDGRTGVWSPPSSCWTKHL